MTAGVLVAELRAWIEAVAHEFSRHLELEHVGDGSLLPDREPPGWPPQDPRELRLRGASVGQVARRPDAVGVLGLDGRIRSGSRRSATLVSGSSQPRGRVAVERRCEQPVSSERRRAARGVRARLANGADDQEEWSNRRPAAASECSPPSYLRRAVRGSFRP